MNFQYLDFLPKLPLELEKFVLSSLNGKDLFYIKNDIYKIYDAPSEIKNYCKHFFDLNVYNIRVQAIYSDTIIHVDHNRTEAFNYIIKSGGVGVLTSFYDKNQILIEERCIEERRWHNLKVNIFHSVKNISNTRIAITVHIPIKK